MNTPARTGRKAFWLGLVAVLGLALLTAALWPRLEPLLRLFSDPEAKRTLIIWLDSVGPAGIPLLWLLQVLQIVIAVLPGGLVELASGMVYGPLVGFLISFSGIAAGMALACWLARHLGHAVVRRLVSPQQFERYTRLCANRRFTALALFLFFLPGVPKDALLYAVGMSGVLSRRFLAAAALVRIPSVVVAVIAGSTFGEGNFTGFAAIYLTFLAVGLLGGLVHRAIMARLERKA